jgi:hypothetical protein
MIARYKVDAAPRTRVVTGVEGTISRDGVISSRAAVSNQVVVRQVTNSSVACFWPALELQPVNRV